MARVRPEDIVDDLESEFRRALAEAVKEVVHVSSLDEYELFRAFKRALGRSCRR
jgi:hypothetical protein